MTAAAAVVVIVANQVHPALPDRPPARLIRMVNSKKRKKKKKIKNKNKNQENQTIVCTLSHPISHACTFSDTCPYRYSCLCACPSFLLRLHFSFVFFSFSVDQLFALVKIGVSLLPLSPRHTFQHVNLHHTSDHGLHPTILPRISRQEKEAEPRKTQRQSNSATPVEGQRERE